MRLSSGQGDPGTDRGVSPAIGLVVLLAITVVLGLSVLGAATVDSPSPAPDVHLVEADVLHGDRPGDDDQRVCVLHAGGETLTVTEIAITVRLPDHERRTRITGFPVDRPALDPSGVGGHDLVDRRYYTMRGPIRADRDDRWNAGEESCLRIKHGGGGVRLAAGDDVTVTIEHQPTGTTIGEVTFEAT